MSERITRCATDEAYRILRPTYKVISNMDVSVALRRAENLIRDTLHQVLSLSIGQEWTNTCGVSPERLKKWKERQIEDEKKKGQSDPRLIYYSDFYDLATIIEKSWDKGLSRVFLDKKETETLLKILEDFRNPEAHRREFLSFEVQLAAGISGLIRSKITQYYSTMETSDSYYPRLEFAQDNIGSTYSIGKSKHITSNRKLRPGDEIHFKLVGSDPMGDTIEYFIYPNSRNEIQAIRNGELQWNKTGDFSFEILPEYVGKEFIFVAAIRSKRDHHAEEQHVIGKIDDKITFTYEVFPPHQ